MVSKTIWSELDFLKGDRIETWTDKCRLPVLLLIFIVLWTLVIGRVPLILIFCLLMEIAYVAIFYFKGWEEISVIGRPGEDFVYGPNEPDEPDSYGGE